MNTMNEVSVENAEHYIWGETCEGWHLLKTPGLSVIEERVPPGGSEIMHYHERSHQFFYILSGTATMETGEEVMDIAPRRGVSIPPGMTHRLSNRGGEDLIFLVISSPMSHGDRIAVELETREGK